MDPLEDHTCPACRKYFSTIKGVHSHLTSSRKCSWYKKEKYKEVSTWIEANKGYHLENSDLDFNPLQEMNLMDIDVEMDPQDVIEEMEEFFQFIPLPPAQISKIGESGPSSGSSGSNSHRWTSIHLDESEDSQFIETPYPEAGYVTKVDDSLHLKWKRQFGHLDADEEGDVTMQDGEENLSPFAPFASELDWRVASWVIKDGIGHKSFDRLLSIPGVSIS